MSSEAYRRLADGLPMRHSSTHESFPTEPRRVREWVEALPRANQAATLRQLTDALQALAQQKVDGATRFHLLEILRPVALDGVALLERQLQGISFPPIPLKAQAADQVQALHQVLATGYRETVAELCAPHGSVPFLRGAVVTQALERAIYHASRQLALAYYLYRTPPPGTWLALHVLHAFARAVKLQQKPVDDIALRRPASAESGYAQAVLLALSNPYRFSQREQAELWQLTRDLGEHCSFHADKPPEGAFALPQDRDGGPGYIPEERVDDGERLLWFDLSALADQLDQAIGEQRHGEVLLRFGKGHAVLGQADLLRRLRAGWGHAAARHHNRLDAGHQLDAVVGLTGLHFLLAGNQDFDSFMRRVGEAAPRAGTPGRAAWAVAEPTGQAAVARARVLDQSLGGYRLAWPASEQVRARVGELVGLSLAGEDERDWMVGVVRWLRYENDGGVQAGVELLARRGSAVAVRSAGAGAPQTLRPTLRAVALEPLDPASGNDLRLLVPGVLDGNVRALEVARADSDPSFEPDVAPQARQVHPVRVLEHAGDYVLYGAEPGREDASA